MAYEHYTTEEEVAWGVQNPNRGVIIAVDFGMTGTAVCWAAMNDPTVKTMVMWPGGEEGHKVPTSYSTTNSDFGFQSEYLPDDQTRYGFKEKMFVPKEGTTAIEIDKAFVDCHTFMYRLFHYISVEDALKSAVSEALEAQKKIIIYLAYPCEISSTVKSRFLREVEDAARQSFHVPDGAEKSNLLVAIGASEGLAVINYATLPGIADHLLNSPTRISREVLVFDIGGSTVDVAAAYRKGSNRWNLATIHFYDQSEISLVYLQHQVLDLMIAKAHKSQVGDTSLKEAAMRHCVSTSMKSQKWKSYLSTFSLRKEDVGWFNFSEPNEEQVIILREEMKSVLNKYIDDLGRQIEYVLQRNNQRKFDTVLMAGGGALMEFIRESIEHHVIPSNRQSFEKHCEVKSLQDPLTAVAHGLASYYRPYALQQPSSEQLERIKKQEPKHSSFQSGLRFWKKS